MTTWLNNANGTTVTPDSNGPTWINNAPAQPQYEYSYSYMMPQQQQQQQYFSYNQEPQVPAWQQFLYDSAATNGGYGEPIPAQTTWGSAGGFTRNGMINWQDAANTLVPLYQQKLDSLNQAWNTGQIQNVNEIQGVRDALSHWQGIQATGRSPQMFSMPQYSTDNFFTEANEASRLFHGDPRFQAVEAVLPASLRGQNQGQLMRPWASTGLVDSNFGSGSAGVDAGFGSFLPPGLREASFSTSSGQPIISTGPGGIITQYAPNAMGGWTSVGNLNGMPTQYNNGDLRSARDYGSYNTPLLAGLTRSGGYTSPGPDRGEPYNPFPPGLKPIGIDPNTGEMGRYDWSDPWHDQSGWRRDNTGDYPTQAPGFSPQFDENGRSPRPGGGYIQNTPNGPYEVDRFGKQISANIQPISLGDLSLPWQIADALPVSLESKINGALRGFEMIDNANPSNLLPKNMLMNMAKDAALDFVGDRRTWRGDGAHFSTLQDILSQPWANRSAAPISYPSMAALFL